jgi:hypothetical protein
MFDKSTLEKVPTYSPSSSEPKKTIDEVSQEPENLYTIAEEEDNSPALLFTTSPQTLEEMWYRAKAIADLKTPNPWIISRIAGTDQGVAIPAFNYVLGLMEEQEFDEPIALISPEGEIHVATIYDHYRLCTRPWRVSGGCHECQKANNAEFGGESCIFDLGLYLDKEESDYDALDFRETLENLKHPKLGDSTWISPIYTKPSTYHEVNKYYRYSRRNTPGAFAPYLRAIDNHDFSNIENLRERQSSGAKTKAETRRIQKNVCSKCTLKPACDSHHAYQRKTYVNFCRSFTDITAEALIAHYIEPFEGTSRETVSFLLRNCGELPWRYGRYKTILRVELGRYNKPTAYLRRKTQPSSILHTFTSLGAAEAYLQANDKKERFSRYSTPLLTDKELALYVLANEYSYSPTGGHGWHQTSYKAYYTCANYGHSTLYFSFNNGRGPLHWSLDFEDIFDGFKYYGRLRTPYRSNEF